ncbi:MAG TPA: hypothetical protein VN711_02980 [Candidatus Saccharimonadales bacterium]|nr:hypothetical protein [Candidatus Saccharimonadales bacterium]
MEHETRLQKFLTVFLGLFWFIDGILQLQPQMFSSAFITNILTPNLQNQPQIFATWITFGIHVVALHMMFENFLFAFLQIAIGIVLLLPIPKVWKKIALWISIPWSLSVWIFGEGLGNLFTGSASFYTGAPGAVFLYLILALFLLFPNKLKSEYLPRVVGGIFFLGGLLQETPMFWTKNMQSMLWQMSEQENISLIASPAKELSKLLVSTSSINLVAIGSLIILGILLLLKPTKVLGWITIGFLFLVWWISQDFGGIFTFPFGIATDPNTAPLFMLFLFPLFFSVNSSEGKSK